MARAPPAPRVSTEGGETRAARSPSLIEYFEERERFDPIREICVASPIVFEQRSRKRWVGQLDPSTESPRRVDEIDEEIAVYVFGRRGHVAAQLFSRAQIAVERGDDRLAQIALDFADEAAISNPADAVPSGRRDGRVVVDEDDHGAEGWIAASPR